MYDKVPVVCTFESCVKAVKAPADGIRWGGAVHADVPNRLDHHSQYRYEKHWIVQIDTDTCKWLQMHNTTLYSNVYAMPILHPMHIWNQLGLQVLVPSSIQKSLHFGFHFLLWVHVLQLLWRAKLTRKCQKSLCYEFTSLQLVHKKARFCGSAMFSRHFISWVLNSLFYTFLHERSHVFAHLSLRCWPYPLWIRLHHCQPWVQWVAASKTEHVMLRACNHVKLSNYETERI